MPQEQVSRPPRKPVVESKSFSLGGSLSNLLSGVKDAIVGRNDYDKDAIKIVGEDVGGWQTKQDAARHILRSAELARVTNPTVARISANLYELITGSSSPEDAQMDKHNNAIGISMANAKDYEEIKKKTREVMKKASYQGFNDPKSPVFLRMESEKSKYSIGEGLKKQFTFPEIDLNNLPNKNKPIDKQKMAELAIDLLPIGGTVGMIKKANKIKDAIPKGWAGEKITSELGDTTITLSAKDPTKVQVTRWDGKAGTSNTVSDTLFDSVEEARKSIKE